MVEYSCEICNFRTNKKSNYNRHMDSASHKKKNIIKKTTVKKIKKSPEEKKKEYITKLKNDLGGYYDDFKYYFNKNGRLVRIESKYVYETVDEDNFTVIGEDTPIKIQNMSFDTIPSVKRYLKENKQEYNKLKRQYKKNEDREVKILELLSEDEKRLFGRFNEYNELLHDAKVWLSTNEEYLNSNFVYKDKKGDLKQFTLFEDDLIRANNLEELKNSLDKIYLEKINMGNEFKINIAVSAIGTKTQRLIGNINTTQFLYVQFGPHTKLFRRGNISGNNNEDVNNEDERPEGPMLISNSRTWRLFKSYLTIENLRAVLMHMFMESGISIIGIPQFYIDITNTNRPLGNAINLPDDIMKSKSICTMRKVKNNLCFFSSVARGLIPSKERKKFKYNRRAIEKFKLYYGEEKTWKNFEGLLMGDFKSEKMKEFEDKIKANINVYKYGNSIKDIATYRFSDKNYEKTIPLLIYNGHVMLIEKFKTLLGKQTCPRCWRNFEYICDLKKHINRGGCTNGRLQQRHVFDKCSKVWGGRQSDLFKLYLKYGLLSEYEEKKNLDNILTYDFEARTMLNNNVDESKKLVYERVQRIMSYAISYEIGGERNHRYALVFDCKSKNKYNELVKKFTDDIIDLSIKSFYVYQEKHSKLYNMLNNEEKDVFLKSTALPVISFNGNRYDLKLIASESFFNYLFKNKKWEKLKYKYDEDGEFITSDTVDPKNKFIIEEQIIAVNCLRLVDQAKWTMGTTLDRFIKSYNPKCEQGKMIFPHHMNHMIEQLLPLDFNKDNFPIEYFFNNIKQRQLDEESYNNIFIDIEKYNKKCEEEGRINEKVVKFRDYLILYNILDTEPFLQACINFRNELRDMSENESGKYVDTYQENFGMPSYASDFMITMSKKPYMDEFLRKWKLKRNEEAHIMDHGDLQFEITREERKEMNKNKKELKRYRKQMDDYNNYKLKHKNGKDGLFEKLYKDQNRKCFCCKNESLLSYELIDDKKGKTQDNIVLICKTCKDNRKGQSIYTYEYNMMMTEFNKKYKDKLLCTIPEDKKDIYNLLRSSVVGGPSMSFHRRHKVNETRIQHVVYNKELKQYELGIEGNIVKKIDALDANALYLYCYGGQMPTGEPEELNITNDNKEDLIDKIKKGIIFGFVECSMKVQDSAIDKYSPYPPFFITRKIGSYKKLSSYLECEKQVFSTHLFNWYMKQGDIDCTSITRIIVFKRSEPFKKFTELVSEKRRDKSNPIAGDTYKLKGNSSFGKFGQNNENYENIIITTDEDAAIKYTESQRYKRGSTYVGEDGNKTYKIVMEKRDVRHCMPIHAASYIYSAAKERMLSFQYDFLMKYIDEPHLNMQVCYMDTDSSFLAFAGPLDTSKPDHIIKKDLIDEFNRDKINFLVPEKDLIIDGKKYDFRTAGLFKEEFSCQELIALSAKSYFAINEKGESKSGQKGCQKSNFENKTNQENINSFRDCLQGNEKTATNYGMRIDQRDGKMKDYKQIKRGVNGDYDKRHVMNNGVNTYPLDWHNVDHCNEYSQKVNKLKHEKNLKEKKEIKNKNKEKRQKIKENKEKEIKEIKDKSEQEIITLGNKIYKEEEEEKINEILNEITEIEEKQKQKIKDIKSPKKEKKVTVQEFLEEEEKQKIKDMKTEEKIKDMKIEEKKEIKSKTPQKEKKVTVQGKYELEETEILGVKVKIFRHRGRD